jgi:Tfp pilus assembly protein PilF
VTLWRKKPYDRVEVLAAADRARARGQVRKAIAGYRKVLAADPGDIAVHGKIAPLLARTRQADEALKSFQLAAQGHVKAGFQDRALAVYTQAAAHFPQEAWIWDEIARLHLLRGRRADAVNALVGGGRRLEHVARPKGIALLRKALEIEPWHLEASLALSRLLAKGGEKEEAKGLLEDLGGRVRGSARRQVRGALFRLSPTPGNAWRWLRGR